MSTRRRFLAACSTAMAAAFCAPLGLTAAPARPGLRDRSLADLDYATFFRLLRTRFRVQAAPAQTVELELLEAALTPTPRNNRAWPALDADYEKFSLVFSGPANRPLEDRIFKMEHPRIGRFDLFISRILSRQTRQCRYQAIFNRPARTPLNRPSQPGLLAYSNSV